MEAKVVWQGNLSFNGAADSGFELPLDASGKVGGGESGFRPMELFAIGLGGCTAMDVISILRKKRQEISAFKVNVHAERAETHPRVFTQVLIHYEIAGRSVDPQAVERAIELSETKYCPGQAMLEKAVEIRHTYTIKEVS